VLLFFLQYLPIKEGGLGKDDATYVIFKEIYFENERK
jgi:hypothetical protein